LAPISHQQVGDKSPGIAQRLQRGCVRRWIYDVFHFYFGKTLLCWDDYLTGDDYRYLDLEIARQLGKAGVLHLARLRCQDCRRIDEAFFHGLSNDACGLFSSCVSKEDDKRRQFLSEILPKADRAFYLNPELSRYVGGENFSLQQRGC